MEEPKSETGVPFPALSGEPLSLARSLVPLLADHDQETDESRRVPRHVMDAICATGLAWMMGPKRSGGPGERMRCQIEVTAELDNVEVEIFSTLLVEFARDHGAKAIVKGMRAISDFEYEFEMAQLNHKLDPGIESIYVIASPHYSFLSSTGVKEMATFGGNVSDLVPAPVAAALAERLNDR